MIRKCGWGDDVMKIYGEDITTWEEQMHRVIHLWCIIPRCKKMTGVCLRYKKAACHRKFKERYYDGTASVKPLLYINYLFCTAGCVGTKDVIYWAGEGGKKNSWMVRWVTIHPVLNQWLTTCVSRMKRNLFAQVLISHSEGFCQGCSGEWSWHSLHPFGPLAEPGKCQNLRLSGWSHFFCFGVSVMMTGGVLQGEKKQTKKKKTTNPQAMTGPWVVCGAWKSRLPPRQ